MAAILNMPLAIPEGLEPLAVWDSSQPAGPWLDQRMMEASAWAVSHIPEPHRTYRVEFYLLDSPFVIVHRFALDRLGPDGEQEIMPVTDAPVIVPLAELPPAHLLGEYA